MKLTLQTTLHIKWPGVRLKSLITLVLMGLLKVPIFGQTIPISGVVKSALESEPIVGVNVLLKGTTIGTVTDANGAYSLLVGSENDVLIFSFVGYITEEVVVGNKSSIDVDLTPDITALDEIVVIGYGTAKRKDITGSISSISGEDLRKTNPTTFDQALQGKVPGLVVQQISGQPGGAVSMQIRGISNFNGSSPLYVIDGIIFGGTANLGPGTNPLAGINPADIESIDVQKDAAATAIYGSQATNGVIIITTKRGKVGPPTVSYDGFYGVQQLPKKLPVMNLREYATFINERNTGLGWGFDTRPEFVNPQYLGKGTDWQEELFRSAPRHSHTVTVQGGDERTQYLFSTSYYKEEGIALGSDLKRITLRLNLDNQTTNWLKIGTSIQMANIKENVNSSGSNVINTALSQTPDIAVRNADGSWGGAYNENGWVNRTVNPYAIALINKDDVKRNQVSGSVYADITVLKDLVLRNEVTGVFSMATEDKFYPTYEMGEVENTTNEAWYDFSQNFNTVIRNYLTYSHVFAQDFNTTIMAAHEAQLNVSEEVSAYRSTFPSNNVQVIDSGDPSTARNSGSKNQNAIESYFGRINVMAYDKYMLEGTLRADGSSKFADGNRWVNTYSGVFAWKMQNEEFMKSVNAINEMKLRVSYGLANNQNIDNYAYTTSIVTVPTGLSGISQQTRTIGNPDLEWESTKSANIGLDGALFDWGITFSVDFYNKRTDGMLMKIPLPLYSGTATSYSPGSIVAPWVNVGSVNNKGFDFRISTTNFKRGSFTWKTDLTVSRNINEVIKLNADGASLVEGYGRTAVGGSIGEFYGYKVDGIFASVTDYETHARPVDEAGNPLPFGAAGGSIWYGDLMFKDKDNDGDIDGADQYSLGSPLPKYQVGLNNSFTYKNFDLNIFFSANYGNKVYNELRVQGEDPGTSFGYLKALNNYAKLALIDPNESAEDENNVYVTNPETRIVGIRNDDTNGNNRTSDKFIEDGSFIRCKTISLAYNFPEKLLTRLHVSAFKVYVNVSNAFLITNYKGMDPEIGSWNPLEAGVDSGYYPQSRVFTLGVNISLTK